MELLTQLIDVVLHLDQHLQALVASHGARIYLILFLIVFCETGLVVTPFLPGDSLLFVAGAVAAAGGMDIAAVMAVLVGEVEAQHSDWASSTRSRTPIPVAPLGT